MATLVAGVGYIGAPLLDLLAHIQSAAPIVAMDNFFSTPREDVLAALPTSIELVEGDIADPNAVARAFAALKGQDATVYLLAAQPSAAIARRDPETTERSNLTGARVVLQAAAERAARVVFAGSFRVYGDELTGEEVDEQTPYGRVGDLSHLSKVYVEQLARMLEIQFVSVRLGVTYGLSPVMKTTPAFMTVPNLFCLRAAAGEVLNVLDDRPMAFVHVADACAALVAASDVLRGSRDGWIVANAAPEVATIGQVSRTIQRLMQARGGWVRIDGAAASGASFVTRSRLDRAGFTPKHCLADDLGEVLDYFLARTP